MSGIRIGDMTWQKRREFERAGRFGLLHELAERGEWREYMQSYADYLEWDGVESTQREDLVKMLRCATEQVTA